MAAEQLNSIPPGSLASRWGLTLGPTRQPRSLPPTPPAGLGVRLGRAVWCSRLRRGQSRLERDPGIDPTVAAADHGLVEYWTIEVLDGAFTALRWRESHGDALVEAAYTNQALDWRWTHHAWGVALELGFAHEGLWGQFRALPTVQAALDAVPDPQAGLLVYYGRGGGTSGALVPRRPRPAPTAGTRALPVPLEQVDLTISARLEPAAHVRVHSG